MQEQAMARKPKTALRYPYTQEMIYRRQLKWMVRELRKLTNQHLISIVPDLVESAKPLELIQDQDDDWANQVNQALAKITSGMIKPVRITQEQMEAVGVGTNDFNEKQWRKLVRSAYGVAPTKEDPKKYNAQLEVWANENAKLISNIPQKAIDQIREDTIEALTAGVTVDDLKAIIHERIDVADSRAELIARDQVAKLNGDLNRSRQEEVGVEKYIWRTVGDERVRETHDDCDGETFAWDGSVSDNGVPKPDGNDPGGDYQCRCWADPILPSRMAFELELEDAA